MSTIFSDWFDIYNNSEVDLCVLIPNGLIISVHTSRETTLSEIKEDVFEKAQSLPLFGALHDKQAYVFTAVNYTTSQQEELDESRRIIDVKPFMEILRLVERKGDLASKQLNAQISLLIGKGLHEFDALKNPEVNDFRWKTRHYCESIQEKRSSMSWMEKVCYNYPLRIAKDDALPMYLESYLSENIVKLDIQFYDYEAAKQFEVDYLIDVKAIIELAIHEFQLLNDASQYTLKVCGREEYLFGTYPLIQYKYIRESIANSLIPSLIVYPIDKIPVDDDVKIENNDFRSRSSTSQFKTVRKKVKPLSSFTITEKLAIFINNCTRINHSDNTRIAIMIGVYLGKEALAPCQFTTDKLVVGGECTWDELCTFDINLCDVPRMARLCFVIYEVLVRTRKSTRSKFFRTMINCEINANPFKWANTTVFDYKGFLKSGSLTLSMWSYQPNQDSDDMANPLGTVLPNPSRDEETSLMVTFQKYTENDSPVSYPSFELMINSYDKTETKAETNRPKSKYFEKVKEICEKGLVSEIADQEKELLWYYRDDCCAHFPHSLPYLLNSMKWNDHKCVIQMMKLIQEWPLLEPEKSLELLDYGYIDCEVRSYALKCLKIISDEDLLLYLLQLVQALKYESYLFCDLSLFLLERALNNRVIGHHLFWLLRSEMNDPSVSIYFGVILEAYCRGSIDHMKQLMKQIEAVSRLKQMNDIIKKEFIGRKENKEKLISFMQEMLNQSYYKDVIQNFLNPLDPRIKLSNLKIEKCKLMDSKMKPIWLVFANSDSGSQDVYIIFKNGDDLRQDMLTLQMFRIMDKIWKDGGLDLRMTPYRAIATEHNVGLIEVVISTQTLANVQKSNGLKATSAFNKASLLNWLKTQNPDDMQLTKAISQFTLSCAGYCVATYVLGVADRHSDNIMIKSNGQILHIDFGHILGKFKEKFGIRRERVPFVLTNDFVYVITKGGTKKEDFPKFQKYCEQAFTILRRKGSFIISLFAMMLSTGIPELSSVRDLDYLRETLVLDLSEEEALQHFRSKFDEALKNSWKTNVNWLAHNIAKDNG